MAATADALPTATGTLRARMLPGLPLVTSRNVTAPAAAGLTVAVRMTCWQTVGCAGKAVSVVVVVVNGELTVSLTVFDCTVPHALEQEASSG